MLKFPCETRREFSLKFEETVLPSEGAPDKNAAEKQPFSPPSTARRRIKNDAAGYMVTLIDGEFPDTAEGAKKAQLEPSGETRRAILFYHGPKKPQEIPTSEWVMHNGENLPYGSARVILLHQKMAEIMDGWDVFYRLSPHPSSTDEIAIREIYLCDFGTLQLTESGAKNVKCISCGRAEPSYQCVCAQVWYCAEWCASDALLSGAHDKRQCVEGYASALVSLGAKAREQAVERGKEVAENEKPENAEEKQ